MVSDSKKWIFSPWTSCNLSIPTFFLAKQIWRQKLYFEGGRGGGQDQFGKRLRFWFCYHSLSVKEFIYVYFGQKKTVHYLRILVSVLLSASVMRFSVSHAYTRFINNSNKEHFFQSINSWHLFSFPQFMAPNWEYLIKSFVC